MTGHLFFLILLAAAISAFRLIWPHLAPGIKGRVGEARVNSRLRDELDEFTYSALTDLVLPSGRGTTQIDQVVVSRYSRVPGCRMAVLLSLVGMPIPLRTNEAHGYGFGRLPAFLCAANAARWH